MDPGLYPGDAMVATAERFPTVFYRLLAAILPGTGSIPAAFFILYLLAVAATLAGAYRLGRWAGGPAAGALTVALAFPVRIGLAGESLYRVAFSHSHLASALTDERGGPLRRHDLHVHHRTTDDGWGATAPHPSVRLRRQGPPSIRLRRVARPVPTASSSERASSTERPRRRSPRTRSR